MFGFKKKKKDNRVIEYGLIQRDAKNCGLFSYFITAIGGINYCLENDIKPIVDMNFGTNMYKMKEEDNPWEFFFEQPCGIRLNDIKKYEAVVTIECEKIDKRPKLDMDFLTNTVAVEYWRRFVKKYIRLSKTAKMYYEKFEKKYMAEEVRRNTIGVLARGTDYTSLRPFGHPVQPTFEELRDKTIELMDRNSCQYIFLVTEDLDMQRKFEKHFKDHLIIPHTKKFSDTGNKYLAEMHYEENECIENAYDYLASILILSKCKCLVAGRTSGTVGAYIFSEGFDEEYLFNKGKYGVDDEKSYNREKLDNK